MARLIQRKWGAKTRPSSPVWVMALDRDPQTCGGDPDLLSEYGREGAKGRSLRAALASRFPDRPAEEIEDAVQSACAGFLAEAAGISDPKAVQAWLRIAARRALLRELVLRRRSGPADPADGVIVSVPSTRPGPAEELIALEDDVDLDVLVREIADSLPEARRDVLALWAVGLGRTEISQRLGVSERVVKRSLEEIMGEARAAVARHAGGGCSDGETLVMRSACGLGSAAEAARAQLHLSNCTPCSLFAERLESWREKAGALLPVPVALEATSPGLLGRAAERTGHAIDAVKRQVLGGGAQARQQAGAMYGRAVDPTPLTGVRPGAVAAVVAGCIAIGGGATYCARQGVDPITAADNLLAGGQEQKEAPPAKPEYTPEAPVTPSPIEAPTEVTAPEPTPEPQPVETTAASEPAPKHDPKAEPKPKSEPEPQPEPEEVTPPPEQSFEPASPEYPATEQPPSSSSSGSTSQPETETAKPTPVPAHEAPQFGGP